MGKMPTMDKNKKWLIILILLLLVFALNKLILRESTIDMFSKNTKEIEVDGMEALGKNAQQRQILRLKEKLFELPEGDYDKEEAEKMMDRILRIHPEILQSFIDKGCKIRLINTNITGDSLYSHLKGETPRGWEDTGLTWDDIPGIGGQVVLARIGYSDTGKGHGSFNLELHETAHSIDKYVLGDISQMEEFVKIKEEEKQSLFGDNHYFDYSEEYFAEIFTMYYLNEDTYNQLKKDAPKSFRYIKKIVEEGN